MARLPRFSQLSSGWFPGQQPPSLPFPFHPTAALIFLKCKCIISFTSRNASCDFLLLREKMMDLLTAKSFNNLPSSQLSICAACVWPLTKTYMMLQKKKNPQIPLCLSDSAHILLPQIFSSFFLTRAFFSPYEIKSRFWNSIKVSPLMHSFFLYSYIHSKYITLCPH